MAPPPRDLVPQAFHISDFLATNHQYSSLVTAQAREQINQITSTNLRPASERTQSRTRFGTASDTLQLARDWPEDWAVDRAAFRKSVNDFLTAAGFSRESNSQEKQTDQSSNLSSPPSDFDQDIGVNLRLSNKGHPPQPSPNPKRYIGN